MQTALYLLQWLDTFVRPFLAPNTAACYARAIASLPPSVLACELPALDAMTIQAAINSQARVHPRAAQLTYATLHAAMKKAVDLGYIPSSPMVACVKPKHKPKKAVILDGGQFSRYLLAAKAEEAYPLLLLMALCGLRRGEALGLRWDDINLSVGYVRIERQRMRVDHFYIAMPLKSSSSTRILPLAPQVARELLEVKVSRPLRSIEGWVCDLSPEALARAHSRVVASASLPPVTLHGLRHSMATAAVASGCSIKALQGILGHSRYQLTADLYADHLSAPMYAPDMARLADSVLG